MAAIEAQFFIESGIIRQDHAAFPRRNNLDGMKAEHRHIRKSAAPDLRIEILRPHCMGGILRDGKAIFIGESTNTAHIAGLSSKMNRNDHLRKLPLSLRHAEFFLQEVCTHVVGFRINIDKVNITAAV